MKIMKIFTVLSSRIVGPIHTPQFNAYIYDSERSEDNFLETKKYKKRIFRTRCVHLKSQNLTFPDRGVVMVSILTRVRFSDFEIRPKTTSPSWSRNGKSRFFPKMSDFGIRIVCMRNPRYIFDMG